RARPTRSRAARRPARRAPPGSARARSPPGDRARTGHAPGAFALAGAVASMTMRRRAAHRAETMPRHWTRRPPAHTLVLVMRWSFGIGRLFGIPVRVHFGLVLLLLALVALAPSGMMLMRTILVAIIVLASLV